MSGNNGNNGNGRDVYVVKVELLGADGENSTPVCEGEILVPEDEDIISLDDLIEAIKAHDLWEDGGDSLEGNDFEGIPPH